MARRSVLCVSLALALAPLASANGIRNVDQPALGTFTSLQAAIDAASEGDLLLVETGTYLNATIDGKALSIVAMTTTGSKKTGAITVKNLAAGQTVLLSGLTAVAGGTAGLTLTANAGFVRVHGCTITGSGGNPGLPGASITNCPSVVLASCTINGGKGLSSPGEPPMKGGSGVKSLNSALALFDCTITGGTGSEETAPSGGQGGIGLEINGWGAFLSGSAIRGGAGGGGDYIGCNVGGVGGDALDITSAQVQLLDSPLTPGGGGWSSCGPFSGPGNAITNHGGGVVTTLPGTRRKLTSARLVSDVGPLAITVTGQQGDKVWLMSSYQPGNVVLPGLGTWTVVRPTFTPQAPLGVVPAGGTLNASVPVHLLPAGAPQGTLFAQALVVDVTGKMFVSSPLHVGVVDAGAAPDCNGSQVNDLVELFQLTAADCDKNLEIDTCDIAAGTQHDCNANSIPDSCDIASGTEKDCNANLIPDSCDIASGVAQDCNGNAKPDSCDIASGFSSDVNHNGIPDECEPHTPVTWWVDDDAPAGGNGSQSLPFQKIGAGMALAFHGDTVMVRDGVYKGLGNKNLVPDGLEVVIRSENGAASCIIDLEGAGRAFHISDGEGPNLRIQGFTIRNGNALGAPYDTHQGGGILVSGSSPVIESCVIESCSGRLGGGLYAGTSSLQVRNTAIRNCVAPNISIYKGEGGGALISYAGGGAQPAAFVNCLIQGCSAETGGGFNIDGEDEFILSHCRIIENTAAVGGGVCALATLNGGPRMLLMDNCLVAGNSAARGGAIQLTAAGSGGAAAAWTITGCTMVQNSATIEGGTFRVSGNTPFTLPPGEVYDSIIWNSWAPAGSVLVHAGGLAVFSVASCDVQGGSSGFSFGAGSSFTYGPGNLALDPLFLDIDGPDNNLLTTLDNDYRLAVGSPCSDAGDNARVAIDVVDIDGDGNVTEPTPLDLLKQPRFVEDPLAPNTGAGTPPLVDLGAFERQP
jgi:hypothetical protein